MDDEVRAPVLWRRPIPKIYSYNKEMGGNYYRPMIDYVDTKERQGIFFERPTERIHLPDPADNCVRREEYGVDNSTGGYSLDRFLVKAYSQQMKETNCATVHAQNLMIRGSKENTILNSKLTSAMLRDHYVKELHQLQARSHY